MVCKLAHLLTFIVERDEKGAGTSPTGSPDAVHGAALPSPRPAAIVR